MGIKTDLPVFSSNLVLALKNLPTTWGLRRRGNNLFAEHGFSLKNLPTTWGLRL